MGFDPFSALEEDDSFLDDDAADEEFAAAVEALPRETLLAFVAALFFVHVGLFGVSLGLLLGYFRGQWLLASLGIVGGTLALAAAIASYRWHERIRAVSDSHSKRNAH